MFNTVIITLEIRLWLVPVSYTHLDVYKRQLLNITALAQDRACGGVDRRAEGIDPVEALPLQGCLLYTSRCV